MKNIIFIFLIPILLFSQSRKLWTDSLFVKDGSGWKNVTEMVKTAADCTWAQTNWRTDIADTLAATDHDWNKWVQGQIDERNEYYVHPLMTDSGMQAVFDSVSANPGSKLIFSKGNYSTTDTMYLEGLENCVIEGNGTTWDMNKAPLYITTNTNYANYSDWFTDNDMSAFDGEITAGARYVEISDSNDWKPISRGDMLMFGDSTTYDVQGFYYRRGDILLFDYFDESGGQQRMWFQKPALVDINVNSDLSYKQDVHSVVRPVTKKVTCANKNIVIKDLIIENGQTFVTGFESFVGENLTFNGPYSGAASAPVDIYAALCPWYNKNNILRNIKVKNYMVSGYGYGIAFQAFDNALVDGFYGYDCRHSITTLDIYRYYSHKLTVNNAETYFSNTNYQYSTGFDTHGNVWNSIYNNCKATNAQNGFSIRARSATFNNCEVWNSVRAIRSSDNGYSDSNRRHNIVINNMKLRDTPQFLYLDNNTRIQNITVNGLDAIDLTGALIYQRSGADTTRLDTFKINDSQIVAQNNGDGTGTNLIQFSTPSSQDFIIANVEFNNVEIDSFANIVNSSNNVENIKFENSKLSNYYRLIYGTVAAYDTTYHTGRNIIFKNTKFYDSEDYRYPIYNATNGMNRYKKIEFDGCKFEDTYSPLDLSRIYIDTLIFKNNEYKSASTYSVLEVTNPLFLDYIDISYNKILDAGSGNYTRFFGLVADSNNATWNIYNNTYFARCTQLGISYGADINFVKNLIIPTYVNATSELRFMKFRSGTTANIIDNTFIVDLKGSGYMRIIETTDTTDSLTITGNKFIQIGTSNLNTAVIRHEAGVVNLGLNEVFNFTKESVYNGTTHQIPFMLGQYRINSFTADADTILLVK